MNDLQNVGLPAREPVVELGIYRDHKGKYYRVLGTAWRVDETGKFVVYEDSDGTMYVELRCNFLAPAINSDVPRFTLVKRIREARIPIEDLLT